MANRYIKCLRIIENWPLDTSKAGRDLGTEVREWVFRSFPSGESTILRDTVSVDHTMNALSRIVNDNARKMYNSSVNIRLGAISASALQCRQLISTRALAYFEERYHNKWWRRLFVVSRKHPTRVLPPDPVAAAEEIKQLRQARWRQEGDGSLPQKV